MLCNRNFIVRKITLDKKQLLLYIKNITIKLKGGFINRVRIDRVFIDKGKGNNNPSYSSAVCPICGQINITNISMSVIEEIKVHKCEHFLKAGGKYFTFRDC